VAESATSWREFSRGLLRVDSERFDLRRGVRCGLVVVLPVLVGYLTGQVEAGVLVTMGALNLFFVEPPRPGTVGSRVLGVAAVANAAAFGAGTLVATLPRVFEVPLVAFGVTLALLPSVSVRWQGSSFIAAVMFVLPLGIPPTTFLGVALRPAAILAGGLLALLLVVVEHSLVPTTPSSRPTNGAGPTTPTDLRTVGAHSAIVGVTAALGLLVGFELNLARDYWVLLTVVVALRFDLASTVAFSTARILGTVAGASVALGVTYASQDPWILLAVLGFVSALAFATRAVNYTVYALWVTIAIIVLLSLAYAGGPALAVTRVLDTLIGGALALAASFLLWSLVHGSSRRRPT